MNLERLRAETRSEHEATESVMPLMRDGLTRNQYADVLERLHRVVAGWEFWAQANAPADLRDIVQGRRRAALLAQDLDSLGRNATWQPSEFPASSIPGLQAGSRTSFLGAMYVMEGSTLGGQYIAQHVEASLGFPAGQGDAYFRGYGEHTGAMWRAFKEILAEIPDEEADGTIAAARAMFEMFRLGMEGALP